MNGTDASELARDSQWQRLDPRMLLVHPINEAIRFLPVLIGIFVAGNAAGDGFWELAGIAIPVVTGMLRYLTTSFRVSDGRVELRRGLLSRHVLSTPVARVRTVDLTASPIHRVLGLTKVRVGTGTASTSGEDRLDLDSLPTARAELLREELLRGGAPAGGAGAGGGVRPPRLTPREPILTLDPRWARFAPFTLSGVVSASGAAAVLGQALSLAGGIRIDVEGAAEALRRTPLAVELTVAGFSVAVVASVFAVLGYLVNNWGFSLTRAASSFHVRRGMFTTRETSIDIARVHGVGGGDAGGRR